MSEALKAARQKTEAMREAGIQIQRLDPIERARLNPQSKALAIKAKCYDCVGAGADANPRQAIRECVVILCPLHSVRPWQNKQEESEDD